MAYFTATANHATSTATLGHLAQVFYKKAGLDRLTKKFVFREVCSDDMLPKMSGRTAQFFRYNNLSAVTSNTIEGTIGTPVSMSSRTVSATVSQYTSFITVSDLLVDTAIDPIVQHAAELLGYQGGLTVDNVTRAIIDAEATQGQSTAPGQTPLGTYLKVADLRAARHNLQAIDVEPFEDGQFKVYASPFNTYDLVNDPAVGGLADIVKYTSPGNSALVKYEDRGMVASVAGCKLIESTNVKSWGSSVYRVYIFGKGGVGALDLEGRGPNKVKDPKNQRFAIKTIRGGNNIADPEGVIGAAVSYNFVFTTVVLDGPATIGGSYRYRVIDSTSSIG